MTNKQSHYHFNKTITIDYKTMANWAKSIFAATGLEKEDADLVADTLVSADARGVYSHGVVRISIYTKRILEGCIDVKAKPELAVDNLGTGVVDGKNAMGQIVGQYAMTLAIKKAQEHGVSFVTARGSNHYGACAYYTMMALKEDMIGFSTTIGGGNLMAPWGGSDARVGNNPFAIAIPAGKRYPILLDMAQSIVAKGKIVMASKTNSPIPKNWAFAKDGSVTIDPGEALEGTIRPIADYKGYGIAVVMGILSSVISNAAIGATLQDVYNYFSGGLNKGQVFAAVNLKSMTDIKAFKERMDREIDFIKSSPKAPGVEEIYLPGEIEYLSYERQIRDGIEYPVEVINEIKEISGRLGVSVPGL
jgi:LDH2 family malate/lactate/ureidoglycolate dehydrogenase